MLLPAGPGHYLHVRFLEGLHTFLISIDVRWDRTHNFRQWDSAWRFVYRGVIHLSEMQYHAGGQD